LRLVRVGSNDGERGEGRSGVPRNGEPNGCARPLPLLRFEGNAVGPLAGDDCGVVSGGSVIHPTIHLSSSPASGWAVPSLFVCDIECAWWADGVGSRY